MLTNRYYPTWNNWNRGYGREGYGYGHGEGCNCGCRRSVMNFYRWPKPEPRKMGRMDTRQIIIHTDKFVGEQMFDRGPCCEPIPVAVNESIQSFILRVSTECLKPGTYYTLDTDHPLPFGIFADPTFIKAEKCDLFHDPVTLVRTETIFPMCEYNGVPKCGIPADPAFPNENIIGVDGELIGEGRFENGGPVVPRTNLVGREHSRLIPVELDLHGNTAFGYNFVEGNGVHAKTPLVLFYTNRGTFSLCRPWTRRTDY